MVGPNYPVSFFLFFFFFDQEVQSLLVKAGLDSVHSITQMRLKNQLQGRKQRTPKNANWNGLAGTESTQVVRISAMPATQLSAISHDRGTFFSCCRCSEKKPAGKSTGLLFVQQWSSKRDSQGWKLGEGKRKTKQLPNFQTKKKRRCGKTMWHLQPQHHVHDSHVHEVELYLSSQHLVFICFF